MIKLKKLLLYIYNALTAPCEKSKIVSEKLLQVVIILYDVMYAINGCILFAITYLDIVIGNFRKTLHLRIVRIV